LDHQDLDVRTSAGEAIALLFTAINRVREDAEDGIESTVDLEAVETLLDAPDNIYDTSRAVDDFSSPSAAAASDSASDDLASQRAALAHYSILAEVTDQLKRLATDGDRHKAKKERKEQRSTFRAVLATVEEGINPEETLRLGEAKFEFEGWAQLIELETLRNVLGVGFHLHFENNPLLGQIFGVDVSRRSQTMLSHAEERELSRSQEKSRHDQRSKERRSKSSRQAGDDDD